MLKQDSRKRGQTEAGVILSLAKPYGPWIVVACLLIVLSVGLSLLSPLLLRFFIDTALQPGKRAVLLWAIAALIGCGLLEVAASYGKVIVNAFIENRIQYDIRGQMYERMLFQPLAYFGERKIGEITQRFMNDVNVIHSIFGFLFPRLLAALLLLAGAIVILFRMNWRIAAVSMITVVGYVVIFKIYNEKLRQGFHRTKTSADKISSYLQESYFGIREIKSNTGEASRQRSFLEQIAELFTISYGLQKQSATAQHLCQLFTVVGPLTALSLGGSEVIKGTMSIGSVIAFYSYISKLYMPAMDISDSLMDLRQYMVSIGRIAEILCLHPVEREQTGKRTLPSNIKGVLTLDKVSFQYSVGVPVLRDINLRLQPGTVTALVGATGSGKTSIINLLLGFYKPASGRIVIDDEYDINQCSVQSLRYHYSLVSQDPFMFNLPIRENILVGNPTASEGEFNRAVQMARVDEFLDKMPHGLDTVIGERGTNLSGGQKQRIAIARALIRDAEFIILDEATSAIDVSTELVIRDFISSIASTKTIIIIGHRISTVMSADCIFVLKDGMFVDKGTHESLRANSKEYRRVFALDS